MVPALWQHDYAPGVKLAIFQIGRFVKRNAPAFFYLMVVQPSSIGHRA